MNRDWSPSGPFIGGILREREPESIGLVTLNIGLRLTPQFLPENLQRPSSLLYLSSLWCGLEEISPNADAHSSQQSASAAVPEKIYSGYWGKNAFIRCQKSCLWSQRCWAGPLGVSHCMDGGGKYETDPNEHNLVDAVVSSAWIFFLL